MASRFCKVLEKSVLVIFGNAGGVDLKLSANWPAFLSFLDDSSMTEPISRSSKKLPMKHRKEQQSFLSRIVAFTDCQTLLNFLCWMPKGYSNSKSLSLYATYILNVERYSHLSLSLACTHTLTHSLTHTHTHTQTHMHACCLCTWYLSCYQSGYCIWLYIYSFGEDIVSYIFKINNCLSNKNGKFKLYLFQL